MQNYKKWKSARKQFLMKMTIFAIIFYLFLPIGLGFFPTFMKNAPFGFVTYAWIFAFLQIFVTWILGYIYWVKLRQLDQMIGDIEREATE